MKKHYIRTIIIASLLSTTLVHSQSLKEKTADKFYNLLAYSKAVIYYKELASEKNASPKNIRRAAECYQYLNDTKNASAYYEKLIGGSSATNTDIYNYSQVLKTLGQYAKANELIQSIQLSPEYPVVSKKHAEYKNYDSDLKKDSIKYAIKDVGINTSEKDFSPFVIKNEVYFTSARKNVSSVNKTFAWDDSYFLDEYKAKYENGKITNVTSLPRDIDSKYHEGPGIISSDGKTMYMTRSNYLDKKLGMDSKKQINLKIYVSKKDEKGNWGKFENFQFNSDEYSVGHPALSLDGQTMYFVSDMPGGYGQTDIYETRNNNGVWSKPTNLGKAINSEGKEMFPYVFDDGVLFFSSDGNAGLGGLDIYFAVPQQDQFFTPQNLGYPINSQYDDFGMYLNQDLKSGFLSSNRVGGKGDDDIYAFTSTDFIIPQYTAEGVVLNKYTNEPITNTNINLYDETGNLIKTVKTDSNGAFKFNLLPANSYTLEAISDEYLRDLFFINTKNNNRKNTTNFKLEPKGVFALSGLVTDANTKKPLNNVAVLIKNKKTGEEVLKALTTNAGDFEKMLDKFKTGDLLDYEILLQKEGYSSKTISFTQTLGKPEVIKINELIDISLTPTTTTYSENGMFTINPIFFDLDKSEIRSDAQIELDKLVETLKIRKDVKIEITSTTDCRATNAYNMCLSQRRANATANYLINKGINKSRLKLKWTGENNLTTSCACEPTNESSCSEEQHQQNRRSNIKVINFNIENKTEYKGM